MQNNLITEFFMECKYSAVPPSLYKYKLMILRGYDKHTEKTELCCFILLCNEDIYILLKQFINIYMIIVNFYLEL